MQHAITISTEGTQIVQAGPDAPRYAQCVWCSGTVELHTLLQACWYEHTSNDAADECRKLREVAREELDRVLNVR